MHPKTADRRVLLVDDNVISQELGRALLAGRGISVTLAADGAAALAALDESSFDLVLMDIRMPGMNGYELTETLRRNPRLTALPVIAMTAHDTESERQACLAAGMDDFFTKPIDPERLYAVIDRYLAPPCPCPGPESDIAPAATALDDLSVIDVSRGLYLAGGHVPLYMSLLHEFERLHASDAETLKCLVACRRTGETLRLVHTLKGVAGSLGATELHSLCRVIEESLPDRLKEGDLEALSRAHRRVLDAIARLPDTATPSAVDTGAGSTTWSALVEEMGVLLKQGNLRALDFIASYHSHIGGRHEAMISELENLLMQYRFDDAIESLERLDAAMHVD